MLHLGDITKINGHTAPIVDCIIGGSPCQDLSVAGRRAGLDGERSGLFMEQVRIAKEMREKDVHNGRSGVDIRPRYMVWENVPGAFSSNGGEDFRVVLEELARIVEEGVTIPRPAKGKWATTGVIIGDGWSLAWRVFDAQHWGVPQRRRRICIVVDFNGHTAPQIVFSEGEHYGSTERGNRKPSVGYLGEEPRPEVQPLCEGLSRHLEQSQPQGEDPASDASGSLGAGDCEGKRHVGVDLYNTQITGDVEATLGINCGMSHGRNGVCTFEPGIASREGGHIYEGVKGALIAEEKSATLRANNWQYVFQPSSETLNEPYPCSWDGGQTSPTLTARNASGCQRMPDKDNFNAIIQPIAFQGNAGAEASLCIGEDVCSSLVRKKECMVAYPVYSVDMGGGKSSVDIRSPTLTTTHYGEPAVVYDARGNGDGTVAPTMTGDHQNRVTDYTGVVISLDCASFNQGKNAKYDFEVSENGINSPIVAKGPSAVCYSTNHGTFHTHVEEGICATLQASDYKDPPTACYAVDARNCTENETNGSLQSNSAHSLNGNNVVRVKYIVRRLTPLECERLQGFPDRWTDIGEFTDTKGKRCKTSDASRYKALGNSIALPSWKWVLKRLCATYERDATMCSLFSGIGGFDYLWTQINGPDSVLWESEIEEFPSAVCKRHFGDEATGEKGDYRFI